MKILKSAVILLALFISKSAIADEISEQNCSKREMIGYYFEACTASKAARASLIRQWNRAVQVMRQRDLSAKDNPVEENEFGIGYYRTLLSSEQKWLDYRKAQCDADVYIDRMAQGSGPGAMYLRCLARIDSFRADELRDFSNFVEGK